MQRDQQPEVWCVQHRGGWCATKVNRNPGEADYVETKCGYTVTFPWGTEKGVPDCCECNSIGQSAQGSKE